MRSERQAEPRPGQPIKTMNGEIKPSSTTDAVTEQDKGRCAPAPGSESDALIIAFVQGAAWWEYHQTKATMWSSDRERAEIEARWKLAHGSLGKPFPNSLNRVNPVEPQQ